MLKTRLIIPVFTFAFFLSFHVSAQVSKTLKTIIVDAGHGGSDAGAVGEYEYSWTTT